MNAAGLGELVVSGIGRIGPPAGHPVTDDSWFDYRSVLGPRGYKYLPPATQYLLAAARAALADTGGGLDDVEPQARGAAVGTNSAASALHAAMDRTVLATSAADLSPVTAPYFSINLFGSRLATEHELRAFNLTLTSTRVAGLEAVEVGARSVGLGRAEWLLAGATEAPLDADEPAAEPVESGAVALVLEPADAVRRRGGRAHGGCAVRTAFLPPSAAGPDAAARLVAAARAALGAGDLPVTGVLDDSPVGRAFADALGPGAVVIDAGTGCLGPLAGAADLLTAGPPASLLVTAAAQGQVAVSLLTRNGG